MPADTERSVRFRFPVTWTSLVDPSALDPEPKQAQVAAPLFSAAESTTEWSMVIPRLAPAAPAPRLLPATDSSWDASFAPPKYVLPKFEVSSVSASIAVKLVLCASIIMLTIPGWRNINSPGARAIEMESSMSQRAWARESAGPAKQLALYRAAEGAADYRLDFTWKSNPQGVSWVFRVKDAKNYFAARIKPSAGGFLIERYAVINGIGKSRVLRTLALPGKDPILRIATQVAGPAFQISVNGNPVSQWTDARLTSGGVGFLEDGRQPLGLQTVRVTISSP